MPFAALVLFVALPRGPANIEGVTFSSEPRTVFVPAREAAKALGWAMSYDNVVQLVSIQGETLDPHTPQLSDGTWLISTRKLAELGAKVDRATVGCATGSFTFSVPTKRVEVDLGTQRLRSWQGMRLIYDWPISSGRESRPTPVGTYRTHEKERLHVSKLYGSPMPYSVHLAGNIYIHGSDHFGPVPGSHGCIRLPLIHLRNVAQEFYNWIEPGVPVKVFGAYRFRQR